MDNLKENYTMQVKIHSCFLITKKACDVEIRKILDSEYHEK